MQIEHRAFAIALNLLPITMPLMRMAKGNTQKANNSALGFEAHAN
jgi:hypothetical protein